MLKISVKAKDHPLSDSEKYNKEQSLSHANDMPMVSQQLKELRLVPLE